jgi:glycosyltransferase involved in cell wall biosynthesis
VFSQDLTPNEIIVVDQTPNHECTTQAFLQANSQAGRIRWIHQREPSLTKSRNRILQEAHSDVVLFIDDDVELPNSYFSAHCRHFRDPRVDFVSGPVKLTDGTWQCLNTPLNIRPADPHLDVRGCNHAVRVASALQIGGYDEGFVGPAHFEETDFAMRLAASRGCLLFDPDAWLLHFQCPSGGCRIDKQSDSWDEWHKPMNALLFAFRHANSFKFSLHLYIWALRAGPLRRQNVVRPWRQPPAWIAFSRALKEASVRAGKVKSPFMQMNSKAGDCAISTAAHSHATCSSPQR